MVSDENKIVKLPVLRYYDENIKKWVAKRILDVGNIQGGKNVQVSKIEPIIGGNRVTFTYTLNDGTQENSYLEVMNGEQGVSVVSASIDSNNELSFTLSNGKTIPAGTISVDPSNINLENYYTKEQIDNKFVQLIELDNLIAKNIEEQFTTATAEDISGLFIE